MTYAMMKRPTDWMPLERHKRSQNAGVLYTLVDEVVAIVDALMRISSQSKVNLEVLPPVNGINGLAHSRPPPLETAASTGIFRSRLPVAAKIALATAGTIAEVPLSPMPPGGSAL